MEYGITLQLLCNTTRLATLCCPERENRLVDRWSSAEFSKRFARLFEADFLEMIFQQFDRVFEAEGVSVLVAEGWKEPTTVVATDQYEPPILMGKFALLGWKRREITLEGRLPVTFFLAEHHRDPRANQYLNAGLCCQWCSNRSR